MSILEVLLAAVATKTGAAAVGLTVAAGSAGVAGAAGALPDDVQSAFDRAFTTEQVAEQSAAADVDAKDEVADDGENEVPDADDQGLARDLHDTLNGDEDVWPGDEGFGEAVADNAREGGAEFGASVADVASDGRASEGRDNATTGQGHATTGDDAAEAGADNADARADNADARADNAEAGADNADAADEQRGGAGEDEAEAGADNAEVADEYRPENPPEDAGGPEELPGGPGQGQDAAGDHARR